MGRGVKTPIFDGRCNQIYTFPKKFRHSGFWEKIGKNAISRTTIFLDFLEKLKKMRLREPPFMIPRRRTRNPACRCPPTPGSPKPSTFEPQVNMDRNRENENKSGRNKVDGGERRIIYFLIFVILSLRKTPYRGR